MKDASAALAPTETSRTVDSGIARRRLVLVVDDDETMRHIACRILESEGYHTEAVVNVAQALDIFDSERFDLVVSDIEMPDGSGIELLRAIRQRDLDVPVVLLTGGPTPASTLSAIELGAARYLTKPVSPNTLKDAARRSMQASRLARVRRKLVELIDDDSEPPADIHGLEVRFDIALAKLFLVYQPIVRWSTRAVFAYEALVRSREATLPNPGALFDAAERLDRVPEIGRHVRMNCSTTAARARHTLLFVNLHTSDLADESLYEPDSPLASISRHVVFEITERARLETVRDVPSRIARLRELGFRVALDDLGAGYAGLASFAALEPDIVKLDMSLVRDIHLSRTKQKLVGSMIQVCRDLNVEVVAEGVETRAERDTLLELGCDLLQGYLFGRPEPEFRELIF